MKIKLLLQTKKSFLGANCVNLSSSWSDVRLVFKVRNIIISHHPYLGYISWFGPLNHKLLLQATRKDTCYWVYI